LAGPSIAIQGDSENQVLVLVERRRWALASLRILEKPEGRWDTGAGRWDSDYLCSRTLYIQGERRLDFMAWLGVIQKAAASLGDTLSEQQLGDSDIPVIVYRCVDYITQCGEPSLQVPATPLL
jgi:Arf-GAP/Rho-GAP domain/ANK repeat/PH domain-containing protein 1